MRRYKRRQLLYLFNYVRAILYKLAKQRGWGHIVSCQQRCAQPWANLLIVILVVEFGHEIQQPLAIAAENLEHL